LSAAPLIIGHGISAIELHTILQGLAPDVVKRVKLICKPNEEIISLSLDGLRFWDSKLFLNSDLENLIARQWAGRVGTDLPMRFPCFYNAMKPSIYLSFFLTKFGFLLNISTALKRPMKQSYHQT